jgi:outer membrane protein assembly factor BamB
MALFRIVLLIFLTGFTLTGCSGDASNPSSTATSPSSVNSPSPTPTSKILFSQKWKVKGTTLYDKPPISDNETVYFLTGNKALLALEISSGKLKWEHTLDREECVLPVVSSGIVCYGSTDGKTRSPSGFVYGIDALNGKQKWEFHTTARLMSELTAARGLLCFGCANDEFFALDLQTGKVKWRYSGDVLGMASGCPVIGTKAVFFAAYDGSVRAVDINTGEELWKFKTRGQINGSPVVENDVIYFVNSNKKLFAINANSGKEIWRFTTKDVVYRSLAVENGTVLLVDEGKEFYGIDSLSGKVKWSQFTDLRPYTLPSIINGVACYTGVNPDIFACDVETGRAIWTYRRPPSTNSIRSVTVSGSSLLIGDEEELTAFTLENDPAVWKDSVTKSLNMKQTAHTSVMDDGIVFFGSGESNMYSTEAMTNKKVWTRSDKTESLRKPVLAGDIICFEGSKSTISAVGFKDGLTRWVSLAKKDILSDITVANDTLCVVNDKDFLTGIALSSGREIWSIKEAVNSLCPLVIINEVLYFSDRKNMVYAIDVKSGRTCWSFEAVGQISRILSLGNGNMGLLCPGLNWIHSINEKTGKETRNYLVDVAERSSPVVSGNLLCLKTDSEHISAMDLTTGKVMWTIPVDEADGELLLESSGILSFICNKGRDVCGIAVSTGKRNWTFKTDMELKKPHIFNETLCVYSGSTICSVDIQTGKGLWTINSDNYISGLVTIKGDELYFIGGLAYLLKGSRKAESNVTDKEEVDTPDPLPLVNPVKVSSYGNMGLPPTHMYRGGPCHTGVYNSDGFTGFPELKWKFKTGGPVTSSPVVSDDVVFYGSNDGNLYGVWTVIRKELWKYKTNGAVFSSPAFYSDHIFCGSDDNLFYKIFRNRGGATLAKEAPWTFKTGGSIHSSPVLYNDNVYFGCDDSYLYALECLSGEEIWKFKTGGPVSCSPALIGGWIFFGGSDGKFYSLNNKTGQEIWSLNIGSPISGAIAVLDNLAYFGTKAGNFYAIDLTARLVAWTFEAGAPILNSPAVSKEIVYFAGGKNLFAFDAKKGNEIWRFDAGDDIESSPAIGGDSVIFGCNNGFLYSLRGDTGKKQWRFKTKGPIKSSPVIDKGIIYFGSDDGYLYVITKGSL